MQRRQNFVIFVSVFLTKTTVLHHVPSSLTPHLPPHHVPLSTIPFPLGSRHGKTIDGDQIAWVMRQKSLPKVPWMLTITVVFGGQGPFVWLFSVELGLLFIRCGEVAKNWIWIMMTCAKSTLLQTNHEVECCGTLSLKQNYLLWPCVVVNLQKPWRWDVCTTHLWHCHQNHQKWWTTKCKVLREKSSLQFLKVMVVLFLGGACFLLLCVWRGVGMGVRPFLLIICFYDCEYCK